jgi:hypothetical protein
MGNTVHCLPRFQAIVLYTLMQIWKVSFGLSLFISLEIDYFDSL